MGQEIASSFIRGDCRLRKVSSLKGCLGTGRGCSGLHHPQKSSKTFRCSTWTNGLVVNTAVLGESVDLISFEIFSNLNDSIILWIQDPFPFRGFLEKQHSVKEIGNNYIDYSVV